MPSPLGQSAPLIRLAKQFLPVVMKLPLATRVGIIALALLAGLVYFVVTHERAPSNAALYPEPNAATGINPDGSGTFMFCFWNVENLFDDKDDKRRDVDEEFDNPFANDEKLRQQKYDHLAEILLKMNGGKGPDILACAEVETVRAADLLKATLNKKLDDAKADPKLKYTQVVMKNLDAGRHIAPCIITRLNVSHGFTKLHGYQLRILEGRLYVNGYELCIIASHWTSQLRQKDGSNGDGGRDKYSNTINRVFTDLAKKNPNTDFVVCGDFNDTPDSEPVLKGLHTTGNRNQVLPTDNNPFLLDLFAGKPADKFGTIWYNGRPLIYDHICVSPGMLDTEGWSCDPDSVKTYTDGLMRGTRREPWRFGDPRRPPIGGRGYSDHFPVTVTLKLQPPASKPKPE